METAPKIRIDNLKETIDLKNQLISEHVKQIAILKDNARTDNNLIDSQRKVIKDYSDEFIKNETERNNLKMKVSELDQKVLTANWIIENKEWLIKRLCIVSGVAILLFGVTLYYILNLIRR